MYCRHIPGAVNVDEKISIKNAHNFNRQGVEVKAE
jgi:hypothetical protein